MTQTEKLPRIPFRAFFIAGSGTPFLEGWRSLRFRRTCMLWVEEATENRFSSI